MEHFSRVPEKSQYRQLECNSLKNIHILHSAWNTEFGKGFSLGVQTSFSLTAVLKHDWLTKPGPKHSNQLGRKCVSVRDIVCHMCVYILFVCVYIPKGADLTLPWKCLNILVPNREVTVCKQEAGVCACVCVCGVSVIFIHFLFHVYLCVVTPLLAKLTHFQSHSLFRGNCWKRGKRADFCSSAGYNRTSQDYFFFTLCVCVRAQVCVCMCVHSQTMPW